MSIYEFDTQANAHDRIDGLWKSPLLKPYLADLLHPQIGANIYDLAAEAGNNLRDAIRKGGLVGIQKRDVQIIIARAIREASERLEYHIIPKTEFANLAY